ncbi:hypothetical protein [Neorhizobium sp. P12A]|uniref:hypothetical protein n=1 Tax=Neorhizobium sp. P12A TaxID=2268027 RepID=UPI00165E68FE|nr:hypothetical protein [Neorhizobium sp. P12A]
MSQQKTFSEGFIDGYRSVKGAGAALPGIPAHAIPAGKTEYQHGYDEGKRKAADS